jgi:hypothetical protein
MTRADPGAIERLEDPPADSETVSGTRDVERAEPLRDLVKGVAKKPERRDASAQGQSSRARNGGLVQ